MSENHDNSTFGELHGERGKPSQHYTPHVICMVGLPARGKTYIAKKLARYLTWVGMKTKVFNVGEYRRQATTLYRFFKLILRTLTAYTSSAKNSTPPPLRTLLHPEVDGQF